MNVRDSRVHNYPPRWNAAPSQELLVIRRNHKTGEVTLDPLRWGLIPYWCKDPTGGRKPINAKYETVRDLPTFRPTSGEWIRTFAIITTDSNELVAEIHDRMPVILAPGDYARWLGEEPDPRDLMRPFPAEPPSRCACGRFRRGSTSRRMMTCPSSSRSNWQRTRRKDS
jgi:putative SOS response-associated peptidase YedK